MFAAIGRLRYAGILIICFLVPGAAAGEWSTDPTAPTPVSTAAYAQYFPRLVKVDDGFVVTWQDKRRDNVNVDIYAQKFTLDGDMLWETGGRVVAEALAANLVKPYQTSRGLLNAGDGGALMAWDDANSPVYFQAFATRIAANATVAWGSPGVPIQSPDTAVRISPNATLGTNPIGNEWDVAADSEGGMFMPVATKIGRLASDGRVRTKWFENVADTQANGIRMVPFVTPSGKDGVYVMWAQGSYYFTDSILMRKLVDPETSWPASTDTLSDSWGQKKLFDPDYTIIACQMQAVPDGAGGVIAVWIDDRVRTDVAHLRVYAQRVSADGSLLWQSGGMEVSGDIANTCMWWINLAAAADGEGGVVIAWDEANKTQRVQRIAADGSILWAAGGVVVDTTTFPLFTHGLVRASDGNFIVLYENEEKDQLLAQKLEPAQGDLLWDDDQVIYQGCLSPYNMGYAAMVSDGQGGAVVAFETCESDLFASRIDDSATAGFTMNAGLNDAWYNPATDGQGFFITVFPDLGVVSLAWFTYDTELPPPSAVANLGDPGHRWLTALGPFNGTRAVMNIELTSGGLFDTATEIQRTDPPGSDGTLTLTFNDCNSGTIEYVIPSINRQGTVPIQRVATDNIVICEALKTGE